jgi:hypothetical protein
MPKVGPMSQRDHEFGELIRRVLRAAVDQAVIGAGP